MAGLNVSLNLSFNESSLKTYVVSAALKMAQKEFPMQILTIPF